jgi:hypothetical protein
MPFVIDRLGDEGGDGLLRSVPPAVMASASGSRSKRLSMDRYNQFCLFCAAVHFLEGADLSDRLVRRICRARSRVTALAVSRAMSGRSVTLPV